LLNSDAVSTLDLSTLLPGLGQDLARALGASGRVSITATPVVASVDMAAAVAIIMTELMTNAVRHGCGEYGREGAGCDVTVDLRAGPGGGLDLSIRDTGGRLPAGFSPEGSGKAGLKIVGALVDQLGGSLSYRRDGFTEAFVRIPAE
jgi:two-component sensor histidine kinase